MTIQNIFEAINQAADFSLAMEFDNSGLLVGKANEELTGVLIALDVTEEVIEEAISRGVNLIVTHHPVIFRPLKKVTDDMLVYKLIHAEISVICAHTNLDIAKGGVNDVLAQLLDLTEVSAIEPLNMVRSGKLPRGMTPPELAYYVKLKLDVPALRYCDGGVSIERIAVCGGSGGSELQTVIDAGCQAYITGDVKHDVMLEAQHNGITLLDAGHFGTETHILPILCEIVKNAAGEKIQVCIAESNHDPATTI